ncbi:MAG: hypothetical protein HY913_12475 [Desulfomonile tiedjei]|nr:hypothetical protein [Desulfomonile tiedjei]
MKDNDKPESKSDDEPLFVLRYRKFHVLLRAFCFAVLALFLGGMSFIPPYTGPLDLLFRPFSVFLFLVFILSLIDLLLFKEVRLHKDRIVLVRRFTGQIGIDLGKLRLVNTSTGMARKSFFKQDASYLLAWIFSVFLFRGFSYYEDLADPQDARKLNAFLALMSGRKSTELNQPGMMFRFIKEGAKPLVVDLHALDDALFQDAEPTDFDRIANIGLLIVGLLIMLGNAILLWPFIRSAFR